MSAGGPQRGLGDNALCGVYYALVTRNDDPDGPGARVRVRFPWMPEGERDQSYWAPLCVPLMGNEFGSYTVPEIDDTVLVVFVAGDIRQPVVIGGVWNEVDTPPEDNADGENNFRLLKSRSGHRVLLDDSDKVKVVATDYKNRNIVAVGQFNQGGSGRNAFEVPVPKAMKGSDPKKGVAVAAMESGAKVQVWCPSGTLTMKGETVEISASATLQVKGGQSLSVKGMKCKVMSGAASNYEAAQVKLGK